MLCPKWADNWWVDGKLEKKRQNVKIDFLKSFKQCEKQ